MYRLSSFSLVISDWMMPGINGIEFTQMVRGENRPKYTYIIMLTSLDGKGRYLEGMEAGADDFITKPFDKETLAARLRVAGRILNLQAEVRQLEGLLPICAYCKKIKDEEDTWHHVESYIAQRTDANFSHGFCPECYSKHMVPQLEELRRMKKAS
jgi:DNA-binding response OmpR family regulator